MIIYMRETINAIAIINLERAKEIVNTGEDKETESGLPYIKII